MWVHGDWAASSTRTADTWFLHGRSDDTIKVAGKRLGPAEVESALVSHPAVVEAAAVGLPDELKGEQLWAYVVLAAGTEADDARGRAGRPRGRAARQELPPAGSGSCDRLPKTRSAKVVRRVVRAVATGEDPGDLSSLEDRRPRRRREAS